MYCCCYPHSSTVLQQLPVFHFKPALHSIGQNKYRVDYYRPIKSFSRLADQKTCPPSLCSFITLITYQFSFLPLLVLACLSASLCGLTLVFTLPHTGVDLSTYVILYFFEPLFVPFTLPPIVFRFFYQSFFYFSPLGLVTHFLLSPTLFTFLTCFSQLASLPACSQCCLCCLWSYG